MLIDCIINFRLSPHTQMNYSDTCEARVASQAGTFMMLNGLVYAMSPLVTCRTLDGKSPVEASSLLQLAFFITRVLCLCPCSCYYISRLYFDR